MEKGNNCVEVRKLRQPPRLARTILPLIAPSWLMVSTLTNITAGGWKMCFSCSFYWYADFPKSGYLSSSNNDGHLSLSFLNFRKYWHCAGGKGQHITCPEDQWNGNKREDQQYNAEGVMCDWDKRVDCGDRWHIIQINHISMLFLSWESGQLVKLLWRFSNERMCQMCWLYFIIGRICLWKVGLRWLWSELHGRHR